MLSHTWNAVYTVGERGYNRETVAYQRAWEVTPAMQGKRLFLYSVERLEGSAKRFTRSTHRNGDKSLSFATARRNFRKRTDSARSGGDG